MCRSLLLSTRCDDYLSVIIPDIHMIRIWESPAESYLKLLSKSRQKHNSF
jgi:hypothetical protein